MQNASKSNEKNPIARAYRSTYTNQCLMRAIDDLQFAGRNFDCRVIYEKPNVVECEIAIFELYSDSHAKSLLVDSPDPEIGPVFMEDIDGIKFQRYFKIPKNFHFEFEKRLI